MYIRVDHLNKHQIIALLSTFLAEELPLSLAMWYLVATDQPKDFESYRFVESGMQVVDVCLATFGKTQKVIMQILLYRIAGYFRRVFIFGYFEEAFFCENKFPGPTVIRKYISTIK